LPAAPAPAAAEVDSLTRGAGGDENGKKKKKFGTESNQVIEQPPHLFFNFCPTHNTANFKKRKVS
jgi:hypothetical protein